MSIEHRRDNGLIVLAIVGVALTVAPWMLFWNDLPTRMASNFAGSVPDGSMPRTALLAVVIAMAALGATGLVTTVLGARRRSRTPSFPSAIGGVLIAAVGGLLVGVAIGVSAQIVGTARGVADWRDVRVSGVSDLLVGVVGIAFMTAAAWMARSFVRLDRPAPYRARSLALAPGEHALWVGSATQPWFTIVSAGLVITGAVVAIVGHPVPGLWIAVSGLGGAMFSRIRVIADGTGLTVRYTPLAWPSTHIDIADIEQVSVIDVRPMRWGGWGYRGSLKLAGTAAVVLRAGPGLRLDLTNDRTFVVTVDRPDGGADVISAELDRHRAKS